MAQFPFQNAILKIESKKRARPCGAPFFLPVNRLMRKNAPAPLADLSALRRQITDLVAQNAVGMVQHAIDAVNEEGQYQAIKYLFEMVGLYPASAGRKVRSKIHWLQRFCITWGYRNPYPRSQCNRKKNSQLRIP